MISSPETIRGGRPALLGNCWPVSKLGDGLCSRAYGRYVIVFTVSPERERIERIIHGSRDITDDSFALASLELSKPQASISVDAQPPVLKAGSVTQLRGDDQKIRSWLRLPQ